METIALFGATGRTGKEVAKRALSRGYKVRALVRTPSKLETADPNLTVIEGDFTDAAKVEETIRGTDRVALVVGMSPGVRKPEDVRETTARNVIAAMDNRGVKRIVRLTHWMGAEDARDKPGLTAKVMRRMTSKSVTKDETAAADIVEKSDRDWTIVRAGYIRPAAAKGVYKAGFVGEGSGSVTTGDLAEFILDELIGGKYIGQAPFVHN